MRNLVNDYFVDNYFEIEAHDWALWKIMKTSQIFFVWAVIGIITLPSVSLWP